MKRFLRASVLTIGAVLTISIVVLTQPSPGAFAQSGASPSPAAPGQVGPVLVPLDVGASGFKGQLRLTPEQFTQLKSGHWYVDLHTAAHPDGELRGQLRPRAD